MNIPKIEGDLKPPSLVINAPQFEIPKIEIIILKKLKLSEFFELSVYNFLLNNFIFYSFSFL